LPPHNPDDAFDIMLKSTGRTFTVPPGMSILDVLIEAGIDPLYDCGHGECGVCQVGLFEGEADHRDVILSNAERAANKVIQICISRARSPRLVLDL
jgi:vanillate O-demethylase ferredoxin subunit